MRAAVSERSIKGRRGSCSDTHCARKLRVCWQHVPLQGAVFHKSYTTGKDILEQTKKHQCVSYSNIRFLLADFKKKKKSLKINFVCRTNAVSCIQRSSAFISLLTLHLLFCFCYQ